MEKKKKKRKERKKKKKKKKRKEGKKNKEPDFSSEKAFTCFSMGSPMIFMAERGGDKKGDPEIFWGLKIIFLR